MNKSKLYDYLFHPVVCCGVLAAIAANSKYLKTASPWVYVPVYIVGLLALAMLVSSIEDWWLTRKQIPLDKAYKVETQIDDYLHSWVNDDKPGKSKEDFEQAKALMMQDWLDTHPNSTRMDFLNYWDSKLEATVGVAVYSD